MAVSWARSLTSEATTANPLPASPARAASIVALSASRFVWAAMAVMVWTTSEMPREDSPSASTVRVVVSASATASAATPAAWVVFSEISSMETPISSAPAATDCTLADVCPAAAAIEATWPLTASADASIRPAVPCRPWVAAVTASAASAVSRTVSCTFATNRLKPAAVSANSSRRSSARRWVRSPSPSAMSARREFRARSGVRTLRVTSRPMTTNAASPTAVPPTTVRSIVVWARFEAAARTVRRDSSSLRSCPSDRGSGP